MSRSRAFLAVGVAGAILTVAALLLGLVGWTLWGEALLSRADVLIHRHERLHFATHLAVGRTLSLCPCSRGRAGWEYAKAVRHAPSRHERALVTTQRPDDLRDAPRDGARLLTYAAWLVVHDAPSRVVLLLAVPGTGFAIILLWLLSVVVYRRLSRADRRGEPEAAGAGLT